MSTLTTKNVLKYVMLPGVMPRVQRLFGTGFEHLAYLMAQIYVAVGLLPRAHPYNNPKNMGRFGIRHVIAESANNLVLSRNNIDKILIFFAILAGAVLLLAQIAILFFMIITRQAWAGPFPGFVNIFDTANADTDLAFFLLARVFGVPDFFCSPITSKCPSINGALPYPIHDGLHALFGFYSFGLLLIGVLIFLYLLVVVVAESAATGTPFGQRFKNVWVPIRLIVAIGLLVPLNYQLNSGQYITLYSAKLGSSLATNGWLAYNNAIAAHSLFGGVGNNPSGEKETLVGMPKKQSIAEVIEFMSLAHTCAYTYWSDTGKGQNDEVIPFSENYKSDKGIIQMYLAKTDPDGGAASHVLAKSKDYTGALDFYDNGDIHIVFGQYGEDFKAKGGVEPFCGEIVVPVSSLPYGKGGAADKILEAYYDLIRNLWDDNILHAAAIRFGEVEPRLPTAAEHACSGQALPSAAYLPNGGAGAGAALCAVQVPGTKWIAEMENNWQPGINDALRDAWETYITTELDMQIEDEVLKRGWAGAGIWFNRIAQMNGSFMTAVLNIPRVQAYPIVMEETRTQKLQTDAKLTDIDIFSPVIEGTRPAELGTNLNLTRAKVLSRVYKTWNGDNQSLDADADVTKNIFMDAMTMILGIDGIFDIRGENAPTHPLTQLVMVGKGLVESTIRNLAVATASSFLGGVMTAASNSGGAAIMDAISGFFSSTAFLGLTAGIVLFYIIPFMPFLYFLFAVGTWIKTIFEAMVGVPLWALAHLRLDGEGLPGDSAQSGYFLILEIGMRPFMILFGLVAALTIFTAQVRVLNFIWELVVINTGAYTDDPELAVNPAELSAAIAYKRPIIDQFFFTVIYTIIVYMLATASFKMIDDIPNNILRWMGASAASFGDKNSDGGSVDSLGRYVAFSGMSQGQQIVGAIPGAARGLGGVGGSLFSSRGVRPGV